MSSNHNRKIPARLKRAGLSALKRIAAGSYSNPAAIAFLSSFIPELLGRLCLSAERCECLSNRKEQAKRRISTT
jgi:hypothetical protein